MVDSSPVPGSRSARREANEEKMMNLQACGQRKRRFSKTRLYLLNKHVLFVLSPKTSYCKPDASHFQEH